MGFYKKLCGATVACAITIASAGAAFAQDSNDEDMPRFASIVGATSGGTFFFIANGIAQILNENIDGLRASAQSTAGTVRILDTLNKGEGDIGFSQASAANDAFTGSGIFEGNQMENLSSVTYVFPNVMQFLVRKSADIETPADLAGKRLGVGEIGGGVEIASRQMFEAANIDFPDAISPEYVSQAQAADLLRNNQIDGANVIAALGSAVTTDMMSTGDFELLNFPDELIDRLSNEVNEAYFKFTIPANTYPNQPEPVQTFAEANWLMARGDLSDAFVYRFLEVLYDNHDAMVNLHKVNSQMTLENSQTGRLVPLHPGAEQFYKDRGVLAD